MSTELCINKTPKLIFVLPLSVRYGLVAGQMETNRFDIHERGGLEYMLPRGRGGALS